MAAPPFDAGGVNAIVACPLPGVALPIVGAPGTVAAIVIEKACVVAPNEFVAVTTPLNVPAADGVPPRTPEVAFSESPPGNAPDVTLNVGVGLPFAAKVWLYALPNVPPGAAALVKEGANPGVTFTGGLDGGPVPEEFVAATVHE
jgi:hypothetical protein